jgi:hypothetical protein
MMPFCLASLGPDKKAPSELKMLGIAVSRLRAGEANCPAWGRQPHGSTFARYNQL